MKPVKEEIRHSLKSLYNLSYMIRVKPIDPELFNKKLFIETLNLLIAINKRGEKIESELGISLEKYEDDFYAVIQNLLKMVFNEHQILVIDTYITQLVENTEWEGTIVVQTRKEKVTKQFKTPEEVWDVLKMLENI